jgi:23S rRNA (cytidine1920-2'-O)/16S rRNA (cytidine1409-2'-O)-methyltransferase
VGRKRADVLLVERGLFESRAKARAAIEAGGVIANGRVVAKAAEALDETSEILAAPAHLWVGRGALKLVHALDAWPIPVAERVVLDIGASTGGFTEVALSRGAARVYAVDVGRGQLHPRLAADPRVVSLEGLDARSLTTEHICEPPGLVIADVSFISLAKVLPAALALAADEADLVALVKPQFEVGPKRVGKGGLVKDPAARTEALAGVRGFLEASGWPVLGTAESPIAGGEGNLEWLAWARKSAAPEGAALRSARPYS